MAGDYQNREQDRRLKELEDHWVILNGEFGCIKTDVEWLKEKFNDLSQKFDSLNNKIVWGFIATIVATIIAQILLSIFKL